MALPIWQRTITTEAGDIVPGAEVEVVNEATGLPADIFSDRLGETERSNPFFANSNGFAQFYAAPGEYRVTATGASGSQTWRWNVLVGTAATTDTGTEPGEVPLNSDGSGLESLNASALASGTIPDARISDTLTADKAYRQGNILGTVSQSGGVPTGAIIERGSNSNGEYVKFADGTLICWVFRAQTTRASSAIMSFDWSFPAAFVDTKIAGSVTSSDSVGSGTVIISSDERRDRSTAFRVVDNLNATAGLFSEGTFPADFVTPVDVVAFGRWY